MWGQNSSGSTWNGCTLYELICGLQLIAAVVTEDQPTKAPWVFDFDSWWHTKKCADILHRFCVVGRQLLDFLPGKLTA
jgi:hypothetical protein